MEKQAKFRDYYFNIHSIFKFMVRTDKPRIAKDFLKEFFLFESEPLANVDLEINIWKPKREIGYYKVHEEYFDPDAKFMLASINIGTVARPKNCLLEIANLLGKKVVVTTDCEDVNYLQHGVIEALMRFKLSQKGYAIVHGSCVGDSKNAYLFPAFGDTGKTTASVNLASRGYIFFSDDLTIVSKEGYAYSLPRSIHVFHPDFKHYKIFKEKIRKGIIKNAWLKLLEINRKILPPNIKVLLSEILPFQSIPNLLEHISIKKIIPDVNIGKKMKLKKVILLNKVNTDKIRIRQNVGYKSVANKSAYQTEIELMPLSKFWKYLYYHLYITGKCINPVGDEIKVLKSAFKNLECYEMELPFRYNIDEYISKILSVIKG